MRPFPYRPLAFAIVLANGLVAISASAAGAATCNVPAVYPTIAAALADATCNPIVVATGTFTESPVITRSVTLQGAGLARTTIAGWVQVRGAGTVAVVSALNIDASAASANLCRASGLDARGGARASGTELYVSGTPTPTAGCGFFSDGFESGSLLAWSASR